MTDSVVPELTFGLGGPGQPHPLQPVISALPSDIVSVLIDLETGSQILQSMVQGLIEIVKP